MKHTKDEIEIKFDKKDRVYLSIILSLICIVAVVSILVPRYYQLNSSSTTPPTLSQGNQSSSTGSSNNSQTSDQNQTYSSLYSTLVINSLKTLGMPYSTLSRHLDSQNNLNVVGLNISEPQLWVLEELAFPIYSTLTTYCNNQTPITIELINQNDTLYSQIVAFSNALNQLNS